jgi:N6-L-threonylcarbamoyladenine synthase
LNILGIETSCDETAAAVVVDGEAILSSVVSSQVEAHGPFGGVVPELASRQHLDNILPVVRMALDEAGLDLAGIDAVAVTRGPGLTGALLVGLSFAKGLALALNKPLVGIDHVQAHVAAAFLEPPLPRPPLVALIVSGGHTSLVRLDEWPGRFRLLGRTLDDAAGEAFDKVGKLLGLTYPAGPVIERLARTGQDTLGFPRPMMDGSFNFSFSGLKTAVLNYVKTHPVQEPGAGIQDGQTSLADVCASFQEAAVEVLIKKTVACARSQGVDWVVLAGGVAANGRLREGMGEKCRWSGLKLATPSLKLCTDNAAMIAALGFQLLDSGQGLLAGPGADWSLDAVSRFSHGLDGLGHE